MSISDAEFQAWLLADNKRRCFLVRIQIHTGTGYAYLRYSNTGYVTSPTDSPANIQYEARVVDIPAFQSGMGATVGFGSLVLRLEDGEHAGYLFSLIVSDYAIDGHPIHIAIGDPAWPLADFRTYLVGVVDDVAAADTSTITLAIRDNAELLNRPVQTNLLTTGPEAGNPVPLVIGTCWNAEPVLIDATNLVYQFHDGAGSLPPAAPRDNGVPVSATPNYSAGTIQLAAAPVGRLTGDVQGWHSSSDSPPLGETLEYLFTHAGLLSWLDTANTAAFDAAYPGQEFQLYLRERVNLSQLVEALCGDIGAFCHPDRDGFFRLWRLAAPGSSALVEFRPWHFEPNGLKLIRRLPAVQTVRINYTANFTQQDGDGLAGSLTAEERVNFGRAYYNTAVVENAGISTRHMGAQNPDAVDTRLYTGGEAEAARRAALGDRCRAIWQATLMAPMCPCAMGDDVFVQFPGLGFSDGRYAKVVSIEEHPLQNRIILELFT